MPQIATLALEPFRHYYSLIQFVKYKATFTTGGRYQYENLFVTLDFAYNNHLYSMLYANKSSRIKCNVFCNKFRNYGRTVSGNFYFASYTCLRARVGWA